MSVVVRIPGPLRRLTNGTDKITLECTDVRQCIDLLDQQFPGMKERLCDEAGDMRYFVNVYLNGEDVRFLQGMQTTTKANDEISIVPAVAGG